VAGLYINPGGKTKKSEHFSHDTAQNVFTSYVGTVVVPFVAQNPIGV
jgi:hypothetical protein